MNRSPIATNPCARCDGSNTHRLVGLSSAARGDYFHCKDCGHVWTLPQGQLNARPHSITFRPVRVDRPAKVIPVLVKQKSKA